MIINNNNQHHSNNHQIIIIHQSYIQSLSTCPTLGLVSDLWQTLIHRWLISSIHRHAMRWMIRHAMEMIPIDIFRSGKNMSEATIPQHWTYTINKWLVQASNCDLTLFRLPKVKLHSRLVGYVYGTCHINISTPFEPFRAMDCYGWLCSCATLSLNLVISLWIFHPCKYTMPTIPRVLGAWCDHWFDQAGYLFILSSLDGRTKIVPDDCLTAPKAWRIERLQRIEGQIGAG